MNLKSNLILLICIYQVVYTVAFSTEIVFQERDPDAIDNILKTLAEKEVSMTSRREEQHRTKTGLLLEEIIHLVATDGEEFIIHIETVERIKTMKTMLRIGEEEISKLMLSLIGGGRVKSITIKKPLRAR